MALRTRLVATTIAPILLATVLILAWWGVFADRTPSVESNLRLTAFAATAGAAAILLAAWMYRYAMRLVGRINQLLALANSAPKAESSAAASPGGDELDIVSSALGEIQDITKRHSELVHSFSAVQAASEQAERMVDMLRKNEVRVADCLEKLRRAEHAMTYRTRSAALGELFGGVCRDFSEQLEFLVTADGGRETTTRLIAAARDIQKRMSLYARLAGHRVRHVENFTLRALLDETILATEPRWKSEALANGTVLRIAVTCPETLCVRADRFDLMEMLMHLIDNAVDAMPLGGTMVFEANAASNDNVMLTLRDQGEGMGDEALRACCEPFFSTREESTGMGLAVVSSIARRNSIRFGVRSARGQGTTAIIEIPSANSVAAPTQLRELPPPKPTLILAVDDNPATLELICDMLQPEGHIVDTCTDPKQALVRLNERPYEVMICDRAMPNMSGLELAQRVKAIKAGLPVIMLTGFADLMRSQGEMPPEVDMLIGKPFLRSDLNIALSTLGQHSAAAH